MNKVSVIIVGIDGWEKYTKPAIDSILRYEPDIEIILIDNSSAEWYPNGEHYRTIRTIRMSYAEAINTGVYKSKGDWILSLNNDILCQGKFKDTILNLDPDAIYGRQIIEEKGYTWLGNWLAVIPRHVFYELRGFDPLFGMCGFEDADFCLRAKKLGYPTMPVDLPFHHHWGTTRWQLPNYPKIRQKNMDYLEKKHGIRLGTNVKVTHD